MTMEDLASARAADDELSVLLQTRQAVWTQATNVTSEISAVPKPGSPEVHRFDSLAALDEEIVSRIEQLNELRARVFREISTLRDPTQRAVLTAYYVTVRNVNGKKVTWEDVADGVRYSLVQVKRVRDAALAALGISKEAVL